MLLISGVVNYFILVVCCLLYVLSFVVCCVFCCLLVVDRWEFTFLWFIWIVDCRLSISNVCCLRLCVDVSLFVVGCVLFVACCLVRGLC